MLALEDYLHNPPALVFLRDLPLRVPLPHVLHVSEERS